MSGSGISWAVCKSAPRCRQITTPAPHRYIQLSYLAANALENPVVEKSENRLRINRVTVSYRHEFGVSFHAPDLGMARSVRLSVPWRSCLGYRHAGCLQLSHRRPPETCGLRTPFLSSPLMHTRSAEPCIPPGSLNRVPASAGVRVGMSPLPGGR